MLDQMSNIDPFKILSDYQNYLLRREFTESRVSKFKALLDKSLDQITRDSVSNLPLFIRNSRPSMLLGTSQPSTFMDHAELYHIDLEFISIDDSNLKLSSSLLVESSHFIKNSFRIMDSDHFLFSGNSPTRINSAALNTLCDAMLEGGLLNNGEFWLDEREPIADEAWSRIRQIILDESH